MSRWFRWHEGTCEDGKFRVVARNAGVTVATVMGVWAVILEDASHDDHRGVAVRGEDFYAAILDLGSELQAILEAMQNIGLIACCTNDTIEVSNWSKRQYETDTVDGTNAERQRRFREKQKSNTPQTIRNGSVTATKRPETETETETETEKKIAAPKVAEPKPDKKSRSKPKVTIPDGFSFGPTVRQYAASLGFSESEIARELQRFTRHAKQNDRRCADWDAAAHNWFDKAAEFAGKTPPRSAAETDDGMIEVLKEDQLIAWDRYAASKGAKSFPRNSRGGWRFPSPWPPGYVPPPDDRERPPAPILRAM